MRLELEKVFQNICATEFCWAQHVAMSDKMTHVFRPEKPSEWNKDRYTWLNTYDILFVIQQYEALHTDFKFLGVYPIDFANTNSTGACIGDTLCNFDIQNLHKNKKTHFGLILNLDTHDQSGSHWVSLYCNLEPKHKNYGIFYYDSVANPPSREVKTFMSLVKKQMHNDPKFKIKWNKIQKQKENSECGMFSIIFLTQCLKDMSFDAICRQMPMDEEINRLRDVIYTPTTR